MSNLEFRIGGRVVCISEFYGKARRGERVPQLGEVLTIREIVDGLNDNDIYFLFEEIRNRPHQYDDGYGEAQWWSKRFRPTRETSIDCFTALFEKPPVRQRENA